MIGTAVAACHEEIATLTDTLITEIKICVTINTNQRVAGHTVEKSACTKQALIAFIEKWSNKTINTVGYVDASTAIVSTHIASYTV